MSKINHYVLYAVTVIGLLGVAAIPGRADDEKQVDVKVESQGVVEVHVKRVDDEGNVQEEHRVIPLGGFIKRFIGRGGEAGGQQEIEVEVKVDGDGDGDDHDVTVKRIVEEEIEKATAQAKEQVKAALKEAQAAGQGGDNQEVRKEIRIERRVIIGDEEAAAKALEKMDAKADQKKVMIWVEGREGKGGKPGPKVLFIPDGKNSQVEIKKLLSESTDEEVNEDINVWMERSEKSDKNDAGQETPQFKSDKVSDKAFARRKAQQARRVKAARRKAQQTKETEKARKSRKGRNSNSDSDRATSRKMNSIARMTAKAKQLVEKGETEKAIKLLGRIESMAKTSKDSGQRSTEQRSTERRSTRGGKGERTREDRGRRGKRGQQGMRGDQRRGGERGQRHGGDRGADRRRPQRPDDRADGPPRRSHGHEWDRGVRSGTGWPPAGMRPPQFRPGAPGGTADQARPRDRRPSSGRPDAPSDAARQAAQQAAQRMSRMGNALRGLSSRVQRLERQLKQLMEEHGDHDQSNDAEE